jgi:hypothetical protein
MDDGSNADPEGILAGITASLLRHGVPKDTKEGTIDGAPLYQYKSPTVIQFKDGEKKWDIDCFITRDDLEKTYLVDDAVIFAVDLEVFSGKPELLSPTAMPLAVGPPPPTLAEDLAALLDEQAASQFSDITIVCGQKKFHCHRCILAARSKTFCRKFSKATFGPKMLFTQGQYNIKAVDPAVMEEIILFIYTDKCRLVTVCFLNRPFTPRRPKLFAYFLRSATRRWPRRRVRCTPPLTTTRYLVCCSSARSTWARR